MFGQIRKIKVYQPVEKVLFSRYDVVRANSGACQNQYFIAAVDGANPSELQGLSVSQSNNNWKNLYDKNFNFQDVWTAHYKLTKQDMRFNTVRINFGGLKQVKEKGINHVSTDFDIGFENISKEEHNQLIGFCEFFGAVNGFYMTLPEPYGTTRRFKIKEYNNQSKSLLSYNVNIQLIEDFTPNININISSQLEQDIY